MIKKKDLSERLSAHSRDILSLRSDIAHLTRSLLETDESFKLVTEHLKVEVKQEDYISRNFLGEKVVNQRLVLKKSK